MQRLLGEMSADGAQAVAALVAVVFALLALFAARRVLRVGALRRLWFREAEVLPQNLRRYRGRLDEATFAIHHPWMKEGQRLDDILVPMHLDATSSEHRAAGAPVDARNLLATLLAERAPDAPAPRVVVLGAPGSGKSVALRIVARSAWSLTAETPEPRHLPVLLTFADLHRHHDDLPAALAASLRTRGFGDGARDPDLVCREHVRDGLRRGALLVLVDGLDELRREDRVRALDALAAFTEEHRTTPWVISCRTVPYQEHRGFVGRMGPREVEVAKFSQAAVRSFVRRWRFDAPKNAAELLATIESSPHLVDLVENPLLLTIVTFLYGLPKYRLPDSRAQFYEVCCRALLEEWDQSQAHHRANRFERPHKEELLARLAHAHLTGDDPEADIAERYARQRFGEWMTRMGLAAEGADAALREVTDNAGLLVRYPPEGLRFPHQTFLEFFAAQYFLHYGRSGAHLGKIHKALLEAFPTAGELARLVRHGLDENLAAIAGDGALADVVEALLVWAEARGRLRELLDAAVGERPGVGALEEAVREAPAADARERRGEVAARQVEAILGMSKDPRRVREVLVLYCGLTTDREATAAAIRHALGAGDVELALEVLCNARQVELTSAKEALEAAKAQLRRELSPNVIELLGQLARNRLSAFAAEARAELVALASLAARDIELPEAVLESLVIALTRTGDEADLRLIVEHFDRLRLTSVLPRMGERAIVLVAALVAGERLPREKMFQWVESLRLARMPRLLYETMFHANDEAARKEALFAMARLSGQEGFLTILDDPELRALPEEMLDATVWRTWGWPRKMPATENGKRIALALAQEVAARSKGEKVPRGVDVMLEMHAWILFVAMGMLWRRTWWGDIEVPQLMEGAGRADLIPEFLHPRRVWVVSSPSTTQVISNSALAGGTAILGCATPVLASAAEVQQLFRAHQLLPVPLAILGTSFVAACICSRHVSDDKFIAAFAGAAVPGLTLVDVLKKGMSRSTMCLVSILTCVTIDGALATIALVGNARWLCGAVTLRLVASVLFIAMPAGFFGVNLSWENTAKSIVATGEIPNSLRTRSL